MGRKLEPIRPTVFEETAGDGRDGVVFVDDRGGYAVLWRDDPRMA